MKNNWFQKLISWLCLRPANVRRVYKENKVGRNELCPCGSGLKFKHCHWPQFNEFPNLHSKIGAKELDKDSIYIKKKYDKAKEKNNESD